MQIGERSILRAKSDFHAGGKQPLPVINGLWIGQLSPLEQLCIGSFVVQGHPYHLYTYDRLDNVPEGVTVQDAGAILPKSLVFRNQLGKGKGSLAAFSDLFRYKLLLERGGWWVDTDVFCLKPFDFAAPYVFGAEDKPVASGVIKMPQGCDLAQRCFELARQVDPKTIVWNELVAILERGVRDLGLMRHVLPPETFSPIAWHDVPDYILGRKTYRPSMKSYAVHLYNEMWRRNNLDKWRSYPSNSALNILRRYAGLPEQAMDQGTVSILMRPATAIARIWPFKRAA